MTVIGVDKDLYDGAKASWWIPVVAGVVSMVFGFIVLSFSYTTVWAIAISAGIGFVLTGLAEIVVGLLNKGAMRWISIGLGVLAVAAGVAAFVWPSATFLVIARLLAWLLLFRGTIGIISSFMARHEGDDLWWMQLIIGLLELTVAVWAVRYPGRSEVLLVLWVGLSSLFRGLGFVLFGFGIRSATKAIDRALDAA